VSRHNADDLDDADLTADVQHQSSDYVLVGVLRTLARTRPLILTRFVGTSF
jgi:hypothetical protein